MSTVDYDQNEPLTSTLRPQTMAILTIRIIKSFPYRSIKNHVLKDVDLVNTTAGELLEQIKTCMYLTIIFFFHLILKASLFVFVYRLS